MIAKYRKAPTGNDARYATPFGALLSDLLAQSQTSQTELAQRAGKPRALMNQLIVGKRQPNAQWVDLIADVLRLSPEMHEELHRAAARQRGYKIDLDLTKP